MRHLRQESGTASVDNSGPAHPGDSTQARELARVWRPRGMKARRGWWRIMKRKYVVERVESLLQKLAVECSSITRVPFSSAHL